MIWVSGIRLFGWQKRLTDSERLKAVYFPLTQKPVIIPSRNDHWFLHL